MRAVAYRATVATTTTASVSTYVAAGDGGAIYTSQNGSTWSTVNTAPGNIHGASYGGGTYKLVGDNGVVLTSSDTTTWTPVVDTKTSRNLYAIAHNPSGVSVAVGAAGTIIYSGDGTTWAAANYSGTAPLYAVTYSSFNVGTNTAGTWVAVGADGASGALFTSTDGITWAAPTPAVTGNNLNAVTFGTQFIAVGAGGNIFYSTDGVLWESAVVPPSSTNDLFAVVRGTLAYSAVGAAGTNLFAK